MSCKSSDDSLSRYRALLGQLRALRAQGRDHEEDALLDEMDETWDEMSVAGRDVVRAEVAAYNLSVATSTEE